MKNILLNSQLKIHSGKFYNKTFYQNKSEQANHIILAKNYMAHHPPNYDKRTIVLAYFRN